MIEQPNRGADRTGRSSASSPNERVTREARAPSRSIRTQLFVFAAALVLVPGAVLVWIAERSSSGSLERVIGRQLASEARHTADRLSSLLRSERRTLASFARQDLMREIRVADIDKRVSMALSTLRDGNATRLDYWVVDRDRRVVASSDPARIGSLPDWAERSWSELGSGEGMLGPTRLPGIDRPQLVMTAPIPDPDDGRRVLGTLVALLDWQRVTEVAEAVRLDLAAQGVAAEVLVCSADGEVIGGASAVRPGEATHADVAEVARAASATGPDHAIHEDADLIVGRAVLAPDLPDWRLLVVESRASALAPARALSRQLLLTMGLALALALALAALASGRVVRPLSELTRAIRGLARGNARIRRVPVRADDELGTLASAFNDMASDLDRAQQDLVEAEKFAFMGELASGVAHEIRTSLGVLRSSAQILQRSLPDDAGAETSELAQMIGAEVGRLGGVVDDLLTLDRAHPLRLEALPVSRPVFRAAEFVRPQAEDGGLRLLCHPASDEASVSCDPELVYQLAVNLLVNATQALAPGGRIDVRILEEKDGHAGFEVRDDGDGIPEAIRERIFQPFVTARAGGVGLGLTFVKRVVHDHHGRIHVDSEPGAGTCFRIELPVAEVES